MSTLITDQSINTAATWLAAFPLAGFLLNGLAGKFIGKKMSGVIGSLVILLSFCCSAYIFFTLPAEAAVSFDLFQWIAFKDFHISFGFLIDSLTVCMLLVVTGIGFLIHMYSIGYMHHDEAFTRFFTYLNLFIFFMLLLVLGNNYLVMFIGWEGVGLCSYLLIGFWFKTDAYNDAAKKAFVMNRIGDLGFLLGMFFILFNIGSLDFATVAEKAPMLGAGSVLVCSITFLLFIGAMGKSAQLPLYTWLPDAMAGPTPVSALIHAATMVTAGIYMIARSNVLYSLAPATLNIILAVGTATAVFASIIGLKQNDIKKVLAYSTVSQLGFMFAAIGVGAHKTAMFHVITHAFFKALLFLGSGSVIHAMGGEQDIRKMGGLKKALPITHFTFLIGTLAIAGCPPLSGFFSKDEILAAVHGHSLFFFIILAITAVITSVYMFRLYWLTFAGEFRGTEEQKHHLHESPLTITLPLMILALLAIIGGFLGLSSLTHLPHLLDEYLATSIPANVIHEPSHLFEIMALVVTVIGIAVIIWYTHDYYIKKKTLPENEAELTGISRVVSNKFYVDEIYDTLFVKPAKVISDLFLVLVDRLIIDLIVNASAWFVGFSGRMLRLFQTGNTGFYIFAMVIGFVVLSLIRLLYS